MMSGDNDHVQRHNSRFLQSPHCAANCLQHILSSGMGTIMCKSSTTHQLLISCNILWAMWYCLVGVVVKAFLTDLGFDSCLHHGEFSGLSHTSDSKHWPSSGYPARHLVL